MQEISIHLMFILIKFDDLDVLQKQEFQYISCLY